MGYRINRTDGELLIDLTDGTIDNTTTDITLIGRNYKGFGELVNENFVSILENFASTSAPANPMIGQLWWDKQDTRLKVYDGTSFRSAAGTVISSSQPSNLTAGDIWIDNEANKLYLFDGTDLVLVGPEYDADQGKTGFEVASQLDNTDVQRTILKLFLGGTLIGIHSPATFIVPTEYAIPGFPEWADDTFFPKRQRLEKGFNPTQSGYNYNGTATAALSLVDTGGVEFTTTDFLPTTTNGTTSGKLTIKNSAGLSIGIGDTLYLSQKISGTTSLLETQQSNADFGIRIKSGSSFLTPFYVDSSEQKVGFWKTNPSFSLDVAGNGRFTSDLQVDGSLTVKGDSTFINASTLRVEDKNIELGLLDDSTEGNDSAVDGGGITLRSSNGSKDIAWYTATNSWTFNTHINLESNPNLPNPAIKFNGNTILTETALAPSVTVASGVTTLGTLVNLTVDNVKIDGSTISRINGSGLVLDSNNGTVSVSNDKISDVGTPTLANDAANKTYVDSEIINENKLVTMDVTGLVNPDPIGTNNGPTNDIAAILELMIPAASYSGAFAKLLATSYSGSTVSGIKISVTTDSTGVLKKSSIAVDSAGTQNETVIQDIAAANTASGTVNLTATRYVYTFQSNGSVWQFSSRTQYVP